MLTRSTPVLIAGGGPFGLMLANELGRRRIAVVLVDPKAGTTQNVQANATQARTMEHYRRLGFADEVRALGLPPDFPTDVAYYTRFARHELARFSLPSARDARSLVKNLSGSWSAAELPHRCNQKFIEPVLRRQAERFPGVSVHYGWRLTGFEGFDDRVEARVEPSGGGPEITLRADFLVGGDGPRSLVRQGLGLRYTGETGVQRDFFGGRMHAVYCRMPRYYQGAPHRPAWMNVTFNRDRRAFMTAIDGREEFAFHTQLKPHEDEDDIPVAGAIAMVHAGIGAELPVEVLARDTWTAGHSLVADRFSAGRIFIGGDAAHLFTPTGGLGYNTAVEDAVNLGWKLAAVLKGEAAPRLLESYDAERRPLAVRNTSYARGFADSLGIEPPPAIEDDTRAGEQARRAAGEYFAKHGAAEFNIPGITFGGRYDGSLAVVSDGTAPPPDRANVYEPTGCPGGRPPHFWLDDGRSLFDAFGFEWTLLRLGNHPGIGFQREAQRLGLELALVDLRTAQAGELYGAELVLIRPDQIVAWRGNDDRAAASVFSQLTGRV